MPKRAAPLTAVQISQLKPDPKKTIEIADGLCVGLWHRLTPTGARSWSLSIRDRAGVRRRYALGGNLSLSEARQAGEEMRRRVKAGEDPTAERKAARERVDGQGLGALVDTYFETGPGAALKTKREQLKRIKSVFAKHLNTSAETITLAQLQITADKHASKSSAGAAVRYLQPILKWAHKRSYVPNQIVLDKPQDPNPIKQRRLNEAELRRLLPHLNGIYGRACRFLLLTGVRVSELTQARWHEFDIEGGVWTIPGDRRKDTRSNNKRREKAHPDHVVPLSRQALEIIKEIRAEREAVSPVYGDIEGGELVFVGTKGTVLGNWDRNIKRLIAASGVEDWSAHAMRRTCSTAAGDLGAPPHVVSVILGHKTLATESPGGGVLAQSDLQGRYNKSRYMKEVQAALQAVADFLDGLENGAGKIIPMRKMQ
jgi:integrase